MLILALMVPVYLVIASITEGRQAAMPQLYLDSIVPIVPEWVLIYAGLYLVLIILPVLVIWQRDLIQRTVWSYLIVWGVSFVIFLIYPTEIVRPESVPGSGFTNWSLVHLYHADTAYNCFPSIHVGHSFVSALACFRVHRGVGQIALLFACLVALSTLFIKQHYALDLLGGAVLAALGYVLFLRHVPRPACASLQYRLAPAQLGISAGFVSLVFFCVWLVFRFGETT